MKLHQILEEKDEKEKKVFVETDGRSAFPVNTISALEKKITTLAKDLEIEWKNAAQIVDTAFEELDVPKPQAFQSERWKQYIDLLDHAITELYKSRGAKASWMQSV